MNLTILFSILWISVGVEVEQVPLPLSFNECRSALQVCSLSITLNDSA